MILGQIIILVKLLRLLSERKDSYHPKKWKYPQNTRRPFWKFVLAPTIVTLREVIVASTIREPPPLSASVILSSPLLKSVNSLLARATSITKTKQWMLCFVFSITFRISDQPKHLTDYIVEPVRLDLRVKRKLHSVKKNTPFIDVVAKLELIKVRFWFRF